MQAGADAPQFEGRRIQLDSPESMRVVAEAVERVRGAHAEYELDRYAWDLLKLQAACELVSEGDLTTREIAQALQTRRRIFMQRAYEANPPSRRKVFTIGAELILVVAFCVWALDKEIHYKRDSEATKTFVIAVLLVILVPAAWTLFSGFMARTQMADPWIPIFGFLDSKRLPLSVAAGLATYLYINYTHGGQGSVDFFRAAGELIALLAIAVAVEARLSSAAREDVPFRGVLVLAGFALIAYAEYMCLHVLAGNAPTRFALAAVSGVLVGMGLAVALLAVLGPMPFMRSRDAVALRPPPPTKPKVVTEEEV